MILITKIIVICSILTIAVCESLKIPQKCSLSDGECKRVMLQKVFKKAADGIPDLNIPQVDPIHLKNVISTLPNSVKLTLEDGIVTGLKDCDFVEIKTNVENLPMHSIISFTCDVKIEGKYTVEVPKMALIELGGESINTDVVTGSGNGKVTFDKLHIVLDIPFELQWRDNDIYLHTKHQNIRHNADDTVEFSVTDLDVGKKINGKKIAKYLKEQAINLDLMSPVVDKIHEFFEAFVDNYFTKIPAKNIYTSDLKTHVHN